MPTVLLDGERFGFEPAARTWGELLAEVDRTLEPRGHIVTDVRFDGLDEPAFREPAALDSALDDLETIEVCSGTPASLVARCLDEAVASLPSLCAAAIDIGDGFRRHDLEGANRSLVELADGLGTLIAIASATNLAARVDGAEPVGRSQPVAPLVAELSAQLDAIIDAQQGRDWVTVADVLQYELEPSLRRWAPALEAARPDVTAA